MATERDDDEEEEDEGEDDDDDEHAEAADLIRAERKAARKAAKAEALRLAEKRTSKKVNLNQLRGISSGGGGGHYESQDGQGRKDMECFYCGQKGHRKIECPRRKGNSMKRRKEGDE